MTDKTTSEPELPAEAPIVAADITAEDLADNAPSTDPLDHLANDASATLDATAAQRRRSTILALIVSAAFFMEVLDGTVIAPAIPEIAKSFSTTPVAVSSGISAYLIAGAIFIPASAWLSDRFGARNVFTFAILLFTVASVMCGLAQDMTQFTVARILQGIGGAMMSPVGRIEVFRRTERIHILRTIAFTTWPGLSALIIGPPIGGLLTTYASWQWIFFLNVPIGIAGMVLVWIYFEKSGGAARRPFDAIGFLLNGTALAAILYGIESVTRGHSAIYVLSFVVTGFAIGAAAIWHATHTANPLLSLAPLRVPSCMVALITAGGLFRLGAAGISFLIPLMLQLAFGMSAFDAGLLLVCFLAGDIGIKPLTNYMLRRYGFRNVLIYDAVLVALTGAGLLLLGPQTPIWVLVISLIAVGASRSVHYTGLNALIFADMPSHLFGATSTLNSMTQQLFMGLGVGVSALALAVVSGTGSQSALTLGDFRAGFAVMLAIAIASILIYIPLPADLGEQISGHLKRKREREQNGGA